MPLYLAPGPGWIAISRERLATATGKVVLPTTMTTTARTSRHLMGGTTMMLAQITGATFVKLHAKVSIMILVRYH